jgi:hypothetical protein
MNIPEYQGVSTYAEGGGPWRVTAIFSGFKDRQEAASIERAWKEARKIKTSSDRYKPSKP